MLRPEATAASRKRAVCGVSVPSADKFVQVVGLQHELVLLKRRFPDQCGSGHLAR